MSQLRTASVHDDKLPQWITRTLDSQHWPEPAEDARGQHVSKTIAPLAALKDGDPLKRSRPPVFELRSEAVEDPNAQCDFSASFSIPACWCPNCKRPCQTEYKVETMWLFWVAAFVCYCLLGMLFTLFISPVLRTLMRESIHRCPRCRNIIGRKSRLAFPEIKAEIMTLKIGSCAVLLTRKYLVILSGLLGCIFVVHVWRSTMELPFGVLDESFPIFPSEATWKEYVKDCGQDLPRGLRSKESEMCEKLYLHKTFTWQGEVVQISEDRGLRFSWRARSIISILMHPPRASSAQPRWSEAQSPDIKLFFGEDRHAEVTFLQPGSWVEFQGTMLKRGYRGRPELFLLQHIAVADRPPDVPESTYGAIVAGPPRVQSNEEVVVDSIFNSLIKGGTFLQFLIAGALTVFVLWIVCMKLQDLKEEYF